MSLYTPTGRTRVPSGHSGCRKRAVILDVDGTLCDVTTALPKLFAPDGKDFSAFHAASEECPPYPQTLELASRYFQRGFCLLVVTGRMQSWRESTERWLKKHLKLPFDGPFMRAEGDYRSSEKIKREIYNYLSQHYDIRAASDDDPKVCAMWRELGLDVVTAPGREAWGEDDAAC